MAIGQLEPREHVLYKAYNASGVLIYVGVSAWYQERLWHHDHYTPWWGEVDRLETESYPNFRQGRDAEMAVIRAKLPKYNTCGVAKAERAKRERVRLRRVAISGEEALGHA